jgi:hypothetical protein
VVTTDDLETLLDDAEAEADMAPVVPIDDLETLLDDAEAEAGTAHASAGGDTSPDES